MARRTRPGSLVSAAATAAMLDGLPPIPCMAPVPRPNRTEIHEPTGTRQVRRCVLPNGHGQFDIPCRWEWFEERVPVPIVDQDEPF